MNMTKNLFIAALTISALCGPAFGNDRPDEQRGSQDRVAQPEDRYDPDHSEWKGRKLTNAEFVHKAALCGMKEVRAAQLAAERATSSDVKAFAAKLVTDHQQANDRLSEIARRKGITLPEPNVFDQSAVTAGASDITSRRTSDRLREQTDPVGADKNRPAPATSTTTDRNLVTDRDSGEHPYRADRKETEQESLNKLRSLNGEAFETAFLKCMVKDHRNAVDLFTKASSDLDDSELKAFASSTLPKLREHFDEAQRITRQSQASN